MKVSELSRAKQLHHAYLVVGDAGAGAAEAMALLETRGVRTAGNPDVLPLSFNEFGVDDARQVAMFAALKPVGAAKYFVITWSRATAEAQNALLKVLEEAPGASVFFISIDTLGHALPTLRSRMIPLAATASAEEEGEEAQEARAFLKAGFDERLKTVDKMAGYASKTQDRAPARAFVKSLLTLTHEKNISPQAMRDLLDAETYLRSAGMSVKSVLGHLAVSVPRLRT